MKTMLRGANRLDASVDLQVAKTTSTLGLHYLTIEEFYQLVFHSLVVVNE